MRSFRRASASAERQREVMTLEPAPSFMTTRLPRHGGVPQEVAREVVDETLPTW